MRTTLQLLSLRARANWLLLAVLAAGILIAAVLLASTTLYSRALTDLGLDHRLEQEDGPVGAIRADLTGSQLAGRRAADVQAYAAASLDARFGDIALTTPPTPAGGRRPTLAPNPNTGLVQLQGSVEVALPRP